MKVSGFTFVRNAIQFDYPVTESIRSILPICDEFVVAVGNSSDQTRQAIVDIESPKIRIVDTIWNENIREGGRVLAEETNKALMALAEDTTWAFYLQADEVVHERYLDTIRNAMKREEDHPEVEGLLFQYLHFYGSYGYIATSRKWYRKEIRIIRSGIGIRSYGDAQGFRKGNQKLRVREIPAVIFHYGWVKPPDLQQAKQESFNQLWHGPGWMEKNVLPAAEYDYTRKDFLEVFRESHPVVMKKRVEEQHWTFDYDRARFRPAILLRFLHWVEKTTGWRIGEYRNYVSV